MIEERILDTDLEKSQGKPVNLFLLVVTIVLMGGFIGATTNLVNGNLSEEYYKQAMGWNFDGIWKAAIIQGVFEGVIYGFIFSVVYGIGFRVITKGEADWVFLKKQLIKAFLLVYVFWVLGGLVLMFRDLNFPEVFDRSFLYTIPQDKVSRLKFVWVAGSISGAIIGGVVAAIYSLIITKIEWKKGVI